MDPNQFLVAPMETTEACLGSAAAQIENAVATSTSSAVEVLQAHSISSKTPQLSKGRKSQIMHQLANFSSKSPAGSRKSGQNSRRNQGPSALSNRGQQERQVDLQIWLLHQAMVNKLLAEPARLPALVAKLEQQLAAGQIRHGAYLFWSSAFALLDKPELFRAAILSADPSANKYRRRTFMVGLLTEDERQQALLAPLPE